MKTSFGFKVSLFCLYFVHTFCVDITKDVFGDINREFLPAAFGDFNADKLTDMFVIEKLLNGSSVVKVFLSYIDPPFLRPTGPHCLFDKNIESIVPSDFDGDGAMDILVLSRQKDLYECYVLWGNIKELACRGEYVSVATLKTEPLLMDYNGDMIADLFGEGADGKRAFWIFNIDRTVPLQLPMELSDINTDTLPSLKASGGNAFVDIDEDLAADLWVSAEGQFEFWSSSEGYQSHEVIEHPKIMNDKPSVIGQSTLFDVDLDGHIEVILPICADSGCDKSFIYVYEFTNTTGKWHDLKVNLKDPNEVHWRFPSDDPSYVFTNTITPRVGDMNMDGYPDILITIFNGKTRKVVPLINSECETDCDYPRTFIPHWDTFEDWTNSVMGAFFDFLEDGTLDVLVVNSSDPKNYTVAAYKNSVQYDAMFVKVLISTGVCYTDCSHKNIPYGTNQAGPSITYSMTSAEGGIQETRATQMSQTGHFALQLPFTLLGLGRNWNFIDQLIIGIPLSSSDVHPPGNQSTFTESPILYAPSAYKVFTRTLTQIIPNSQLVIIPYPMDMPSSWISKLFITPSQAMILTAGSLIATCLFVAAIIAALHFKEKKQDKKERRQQAQRFHFDAM